MRDPAFLFYPSDFLTGCTNLTMEERGQYISLLCIQHQTGHFSEKTIRLSVGNVSVDVLSKFETDENGLYFNSRLEAEIEKRSQFIDSRRINGSLGGRPKKPIGLASGKPSAKPNAKPRKNLVININEIEIKDIIEYFVSNGYTETSATKFFNYYSASGWVDSNGKKVSNWKLKAQGIWFKDENKINKSTDDSSTRPSQIIDQYDIPHGDHFGYDQSQLIERINNGLYAKKK